MNCDLLTIKKIRVLFIAQYIMLLTGFLSIFIKNIDILIKINNFIISICSVMCLILIIKNKHNGYIFNKKSSLLFIGINLFCYISNIFFIVILNKKLVLAQISKLIIYIIFIILFMAILKKSNIFLNKKVLLIVLRMGVIANIILNIIVWIASIVAIDYSKIEFADYNLKRIAIDVIITIIFETLLPLWIIKWLISQNKQ